MVDAGFGEGRNTRTSPSFAALRRRGDDRHAADCRPREGSHPTARRG